MADQVAKVRSQKVHLPGIDVKTRTAKMSVSSATDQVLRFVAGVGVAWEVLDHSNIRNIDLSRFSGDNGGPLLWNHDRSVIIGRFIPSGLADGKLQGEGRFGKNGKAAEVFQDVQDAIVVDTSVYYDYDPKDVEVIGQRDGYPVALVKKWSLTEASMVPVPADISTGIGRALPVDPDANNEIGEVEPEVAGTDGQVIPDGVLDNADDDDPEDASTRDKNPDCQNPDCTEEDPCDQCQSEGYSPERDDEDRACDSPGCTPENRCDRCANRSLSTVTDQIPGDHAPASATASGQRSSTPADNADTPRKAVYMAPEEKESADQAAGSTISQVASPEVAEAVQIRAIAEQLGHGRKADEFLGSLPLAQARQAIMQYLHTNAPSATPKSLEELGASKKEVAEFNYGRACLNAVGLAEGGREGKNFEAEISDTLRKGMPANYKQRGGIFLPYAVEKSGQERSNAMSETSYGSGNKGGEFVFLKPGQVIDVLRNALVLNKLGATIFTGLDAPLGLPRQDTDVVAYWLAEDGGSDVTESEMATSLVTLVPKTLQATTATTRQLLELAQRQDDIQARIMNSIAFASSKAIDYAGMFGPGTGNAPTGIWSTGSVNAVSFGVTAGVVPTAPYAYQDIIKMITAVAAANVQLNRPAFVTTPQMAGVLSSVLKFSVNGASQLWDGSILEGNMAGFPAIASNQVPASLNAGTNCHGLIFGSWENLLVGIFGNGFEVIVDPYSLKKRGIIEITSFNMADVKLAHAAAFSMGQNICVTGTAQSSS